jgi:hypothetical protein
MILASCTESYAGSGVKGGYGVVGLALTATCCTHRPCSRQITFAEGGVRFAFPSNVLLSVFRMLSSSTWSTLRTIPALRAYIPATMPTEGGYMLQGSIAWKDVIRSLETSPAPPRRKEVACSMETTRTAQATHLVFRQVLLSVVEQIIAPHFGPNALLRPIEPPSITPFKQAGDITIPHIVVTPPASSRTKASVNTVPTPQDAAFGNKLTVPDPEFAVINPCESHEDSYADMIRLGELDLYPGSLFGSFGGNPSPSWGDPETEDDVTCDSWEEESKEDASVLGLGPTWSG